MKGNGMALQREEEDETPLKSPNLEVWKSEQENSLKFETQTLRCAQKLQS